MSTCSLGLLYHEKFVQEYLQFARKKRLDCLKSVKSSFESLKESQLIDDTTFTSNEVGDMFTAVWKAIEADLEAELINSSHVSAILIQQLFQQAENVHLKMQPRIALLEDKDLLDKMAAYEQHISTVSVFPNSTNTLTPLKLTEGESLHKEVRRLTAENAKLKNYLESSANKDEILTSIDAVPESDRQISFLNEQLVQLQHQHAIDQDTCKKLQLKIDETTENLMRITKELERTKHDLEQKFSDSAQYQNMKMMLSSKNEQLRELRGKLSK